MRGKHRILLCLLAGLTALLWFSALRAEAQTSLNGLPQEAAPTNPIYWRAPEPNDTANDNAVYMYFGRDETRCKERYGISYYGFCSGRFGLSGKKITSGVAISPAIPGEWRWMDDDRISFTPSGHWLAGQAYSVTLDIDRLGLPARLLVNGGRESAFKIYAEPLTPAISKLAYMQDPEDAARRLVTGRVTVNYPVVPASLKERISFRLEDSGDSDGAETIKDIPFEFTMEPGARDAVVTALLPELSDKQRYLTMTIARGVVPAHGGKASGDIVTERARIPTLSSYLALSGAAAAIARDEDGTPGQIVSLSSNVKTTPTEVKGKLTAYLLPRDHPVKKRDAAGKPQASPPYEWKAENEVTPAILKQAEKLELGDMKNPGLYTTHFGFPVTVPAGRYVYMTVDKGLTAFGGYTLERAFSRIVKTPAMPADIEIMQQGSILTMNGEKKILLHARGTDELQIEVAHILPEALSHFISQTRGDIRSPAFRNWDFSLDDVSVLDSKSVKMAYRPPALSQYAAFDFAPYIRDGRKGVFVVKIRGYKDGVPVGATQQRFVLVSDIGFVVKKNASGTRDVFVMSFAGGKPVAGADIAVLGKNGLPVTAGRSDAEGHFTLPDFRAYGRDRAPVAITARKGEDYAFIPLDREDRSVDISRFDTGGLTIPGEGLTVFAFSDRGIYRPGETVHLGFIAKNGDWTPLPQSLPLRLEIEDPQGRIVLQKMLPFSEPGLNEAAFETRDVSPTGAYAAYIYMGDENSGGSLLGSASFRVEEFTPDKLRIKTALLADGAPVTGKGWIRPEGLTADVDLSNLYGTPASGRRVTGKVTLAPARIAFKGFEDFTFYDSAAAKPRAITYSLREAETGADGKASLPLDLDTQQSASYSLSLETTGFEAGSGRGVTAYTTALVSPMDVVIGHRKEAGLSYLRKGSTASLPLIALGPDLEKKDPGRLSLELIRKSYVSTLVKRGNGAYAYEAVPKEDIVSTADFAFAGGAAQLSMPTGESGDFIYRLKDAEGTIVASIPFTVAGGSGRSALRGGVDRETVIDVKAGKERYAPGEAIELSITAPYAGAGLITLESDRVIAHKWFRAKGGHAESQDKPGQDEGLNTIERIDIPRDFAGKGYISVSFVRDIASRDIYASPFSQAVIPFIAETEARDTRLHIDAPEKARPGEPVTITYSANGPGKAIIMAVDEGILQVARHQTPDPVDYFLMNRALQVETSQMLDLLMAEYALVRELAATGGDAAAEEAVLGKHLNPFKRKTLAPAAYWSGIVDVGAEARTLAFTPPAHFNGEMRIMAVAVSEGRVGHAEAKTTVRNDLVVTLNAPYFLAPGDRALASVTVANGIAGSGENAAITLEIAGTEGLTLEDAPRRMSVAENTEKTASFTVVATDRLGPASITATASPENSGTADGNAGADVTAETTLSLRPAAALETSLVTGYAKTGKARVASKRSLYPDFAGKELSVSALPVTYIAGLLRYLDRYPYGCTEQLLSAAYPVLSLSAQPAFAHLAEDRERKIASAVAMLQARQTGDGGFGMWPGTYESNPEISVYAIDFLLQARDKSFPVPDYLIENGLNYLREEANRTVSRPETTAYAIYVLTRSGYVTTNEILHLLDYYKSDRSPTAFQYSLAAPYIAASYKLMQQDALAEKTIDEFADGIRGTEAGYDIGPGRAATYISLLYRHFPDRAAKLDKNIVFSLAHYIDEGKYNTFLAAIGIRALADYIGGEDAAAKTRDITLRLVPGGAEEKVSARASAAPIALPPETEAAEIAVTPAGPLFYALAETGYDRLPAAAEIMQGLEISRVYQTLDGAPVTGPVKLGDTIEAIINIRAQGDDVDNVAIVDLLPAGFALDFETAGDGSTLQTHFIDKREDRIIAFADIGRYDQFFRYRLQATAAGDFTVPPAYAEAMYDLTKRARGTAARLAITDAP